MNIRISDATLMDPEKTPRPCLSLQCPGVLGIHSFWRGVHCCSVSCLWMLSQGPFSTTYLKYIREGDDNVEDDINPDQDVDQVVEPVPPVCYKDRHILQQYRGLDKNDCRIID